MSKTTHILFFSTVLLVFIIGCWEYKQSRISSFQVPSPVVLKSAKAHKNHISSGGETIKTTIIKTTVSSYWELLNKTYVEQHLSNPFVEGRECGDVLCSEFLTEKDLTNVKKCKRPKHLNIIPKCHFQNGTGKRLLALRSFPGSGNTWTRQLLEKSTGICTGIVVVDFSTSNLQLLCSWHANNSGEMYYYND